MSNIDKHVASELYLSTEYMCMSRLMIIQTSRYHTNL